MPGPLFATCVARQQRRRGHTWPAFLRAPGAKTRAHSRRLASAVHSGHPAAVTSAAALAVVFLTACATPAGAFSVRGGGHMPPRFGSPPRAGMVPLDLWDADPIFNHFFGAGVSAQPRSHQLQQQWRQQQQPSPSPPHDSSPPPPPPPQQQQPPQEVQETQGAWVVTLDTAGFAIPHELRVTLDGDKLRVSGKKTCGGGGGTPVRSPCFPRNLAREYDLSRAKVDADSLSASRTTDGALQIVIPKLDKPAPRNIRITPVDTEPFVATQEWQAVKPHQAIPAGLHVTVDMQTGRKLAKLMEPTAATDTMRATTTSAAQDSTTKQGATDTLDGLAAASPDATAPSTSTSGGTPAPTLRAAAQSVIAAQRLGQGGGRDDHEPTAEPQQLAQDTPHTIAVGTSADAAAAAANDGSSADVGPQMEHIPGMA